MGDVGAILRILEGIGGGHDMLIDMSFIVGSPRGGATVFYQTTPAPETAPAPGHNFQV